MSLSKGNVFYMNSYSKQKQSDRLYNFKVGDEVWHVSEPGRYGVVSSIDHHLNRTTIYVRWTSLSVIGYASGVRPKSLPRAVQPDCGKLRHTNTVKG